MNTAQLLQITIYQHIISKYKRYLIINIIIIYNVTILSLKNKIIF